MIHTDEQYLFNIGEHFKSYLFLGSHKLEQEEQKRVSFCVWAPNAKEVYVVGDFNNWEKGKNPLIYNNQSGFWYDCISGIEDGSKYKYLIVTQETKEIYKSDPYAVYSEIRPNSASIVWDINTYKWNDKKWLKKRFKKEVFDQPINIYELHLGTWKRKENGEFYNYRETADMLVPYIKEMGYTHIEIMPVMEHPFDGSWGYQLTGYYSVTSRYGTPSDFMYLIDKCHQNNIAVILDWVPGHFCKDEHGLYKFDGTDLFGYFEHKQWGTVNFSLEKKEVQSFLISNAVFWFDKYHIDGLRVDGVSSMLFLNFGFENSEDAPKNKYGGSHNLDAIDFFRKLNKVVFSYFPNVLMMAEESSSFPLVTAPGYNEGLGFNFKWDLGWMNDTLRYMKQEPSHRSYHHNLITFSMHYAFSENFILPLSHDEVVHGKKSLIEKMSGDYWNKFANLRVLFAYMILHPGKKLSFMGNEIAQFIEWKDSEQLEWFLLEYEMHKKFKIFIKKLNSLYKRQKSLWEIDHHWDGFKWIDADNKKQSIFSFMRIGKEKDEYIIALLNFKSKGYSNFKAGVPERGRYRIIFNSDEKEYGGSGYKIKKTSTAKDESCQGQPYAIEINIPPLSAIVIKKIKQKE